MRILEDGFLVISLNAYLQQSQVAAEELEHDHAQSKDICLLIVLFTKQHLHAQDPRVVHLCMHDVLILSTMMTTTTLMTITIIIIIIIMQMYPLGWLSGFSDITVCTGK